MSTGMLGWRAGQKALKRGARSPAQRVFRQADVSSVRRLAAEFGTRSGVESARLPDFVLAVSEAAACAVAGGPWTAQLRLWTTEQHVFCEVHGDAVPRHRAGGPAHGEAEALRRRLLRQLCDYASFSSSRGGVTVFLSIRVI